MATDRSGWRSPGPAKLVALAVLTALVVGGLLVASWGDGAGEVSDASENPVRAETNANTGAQTESTSTPESTDGGKSTKKGVTSTDGQGPDEPVSGTPTATATEPAEVAIAAVSRLVTEAAPAVFRLTRTGETGSALTVAVAVAESGSMLAGEGRETATFAAGERTTTLSVALRTTAMSRRRAGSRRQSPRGPAT